MGQREIIPCGSGVERVHLFFFDLSVSRAFVRAARRAGAGTRPPPQISNAPGASLTRSVTFTLNPRRPPRGIPPVVLRAGAVVGLAFVCCPFPRTGVTANALTVKRRRSRFARLCATNLQLSSSKSARWARVRGDAPSRRIRITTEIGKCKIAESAPLLNL